MLNVLNLAAHHGGSFSSHFRLDQGNHGSLTRVVELTAMCGVRTDVIEMIAAFSSARRSTRDSENGQGNKA
jgi:hypothetical protein